MARFLTRRVHSDIRAVASAVLPLLLVFLFVPLTAESAAPVVSTRNGPAITSVTPSQAYNFQSTTITITGSGFVAGATVTLGTMVLTTTITSDTSITATVPAELFPGAYDVTVTNPDAQSAALMSGFTVLSGRSGVLPQWQSIPDGGALLVASTGPFLFGAGVFFDTSLGGYPIRRATVDQNGVVSSWTTLGGTVNLASAPDAIVTDGRYLWIWDNDLASGHPAVLRAPINTDGSLGAWTTEALTLNNTAYFTLVAHGGFLYAFGGFGNCEACGTPTLCRYQINADGSLTQVEVVAMPAFIATNSGVGLSRDYLYLDEYGLQNNLPSPIISAHFNPDGTLAWGPTTPWPGPGQENGSYRQVVSIGTFVYAIDSRRLTDHDVRTFRATIQSGGTFSSWDEMPNHGLQSDCFNEPWTAPVTAGDRIWLAWGGCGSSSAVIAEFSPFTLTSIAPPSGPTSGGTLAVLRGTDFLPGATVIFGDQSATNVSVEAFDLMTLTTPAHASGLVDVTIANLDGRTTTLPLAFSYETPAAGCSLTVSPTSFLDPLAGATGLQVFVTAPAGCKWTAASENPVYVTITSGLTGTGNGTVVFDLRPLTSGLRTGMLIVQGSNFTGAWTVRIDQGPLLAVSQTSLVFAANNTGSVLSNLTVAPPVGVTFSDTTTVTWTATADQPWLQIAPASGSGAGQFTLTPTWSNVLPPSGVAQATITVQSSGVVGGARTIAVSLSLLPSGVSAPPFGTMDTPSSGATGLTGSVAVTGWALDDVAVAGVRIYRTCFAFDSSCQVIGGHGVVFIGDAVFQPGARPDVEAAFPSYPNTYRSGWGYLVLTNVLPHVPNGTLTGGQGTMDLLAFATDTDGHVALIGDHTITLDNDHIVKPFGAIDTPAQGGTIDGVYVNFGWALTPPPAIIPTDGSTMKVLVDGVVKGTITYNLCRSGSTPSPPIGTCQDDVATLFPVYRNITDGSGAIGYFILDTRTLTNGLHSIVWAVTDSAGQNDGIGSRYFAVQNDTALRASTTMARSTSLAADSDGTVRVRLGFDPDAPLQLLDDDSFGIRVITLPDLGRLELHIGGPIARAEFVVNGGPRDLPVGSRVNASTGVFTWAPPPGYLGVYTFLFTRADGARILVNVTIRHASDARRP